MRRVASATHGSPDVIGLWRDHGLRTDRAANLVQLQGMRYRESCRSRQSLRGYGVRRTLNRVGARFESPDVAPPKAGPSSIQRVSAHQLFRCHIWPRGSPSSED